MTTDEILAAPRSYGVHQTSWGYALTREQQFEWDWANYARWAIGPLQTRAEYRYEWEHTHANCPDCQLVRLSR